MLTVQEPDGTRRKVASVVTTWEHVGNRVAEGDVAEADRAAELRRLYEGQLNAMHKELCEWRDRALVAEAAICRMSA